MHVENGNILDVLFAGKDSGLFAKQGKLWINDLFLNNDNDHDNHHQQPFDDHKKFIQYYCRLRGNLLFVIDLDNSKIISKPLNLIILSQNFNIKLCDSKPNCSLFEFCLVLNVHKDTNKKKNYHFACNTIEDRDDWIKNIYLASFHFLRSLHKALGDDFLQKQNSYQHDAINDGVDYHHVDLLKYLRIIIGCDNVLTLCNHSGTSPRFFIKLFSRNPLKKQEWKFLGQTESIQSKSPQFVNSISIFIDVDNFLEIELKFELHYVIETHLKIEFLYAYAYEKIIANQIDTPKIFKLNLKNPKTNKLVGKLKFQIIDNSNDNSHHQFTLNHSKMSNKPIIIRNEHNENISSNLFNASSTKRLFFSAYDQSIASKIILEECMQDTRFVFVIPMIILKSHVKDEDFIRNSILEQAKLLSKCDFYHRLIDFHSQNIKSLENIVNEIASFMVDHTFRSSTMKKDLFLQFVPINFHRQLFRVNFEGKSSNILRIYTVGAFACHHYGFEKYNWKLSMLMNLVGNQTIDEFVCVDETWKLLQKLMKISHNERIISDCLNDLIKHFKNDNKSEIKFLYERIYSYAEEVIDLIAKNDGESFVNQMNTIMSNHVPSYSEECQLEPIDLTYLNIKACFVDINDKIERQKNQKKCLFNEFEPCNRKLRNAIASLRRTILACYISSFAELKSSKDIEHLHQIKFRWLSLMSQSLTTLIIFIQDHLLDDKINIKFLANIHRTGFISILYETLLSCFSEETGMLEDMIFALDTISNITTITFRFDGQTTSDSTLMIPEIDFNNNKIHLLFHIHPLKIDGKLVINSDRIECQMLLLIFNVGVNQQASLPNNIFKKSLQEEVNEVSFSKLGLFINQFYSNDDHVKKLLKNLETELKSFKSKNIKILELANEIIRHLNGIKVTCCKSAKDRTGMSVTLEEVRYTFKFLNLQKDMHSHLFQTMLDTLRRDGTRIENVQKNIGAKKYAFNYLCLLTFPMEFRPPSGTYSNVES